MALDNMAMDTEHTQVFRPSRIRVVGWLLLSAAFVGGGIFMVSVGQHLGWLAIAFFGLGVVVFALQLLPNCSYVRVEPDGFTVRSLFRSHSCRWSDVGAFKVAQLRRQQMVVFSFASHYRGPRRLSRINVQLVGAEAAVAASGSVNIEMNHLADLMNAFRERYGVV